MRIWTPEEIRRFHYTYTKAELESWFEELTAAYRKWAQMQLEWKHARKDSIGKTVFPYPYREGQKDLAAAVYRTIWHREKAVYSGTDRCGKNSFHGISGGAGCRTGSWGIRSFI